MKNPVKTAAEAVTQAMTRKRTENNIEDDIRHWQSIPATNAAKIALIRAEIGDMDEGADITRQANEITRLEAQTAAVPRKLEALQDELREAEYQRLEKGVTLRFGIADSSAQKAADLITEIAILEARVMALRHAMPIREAADRDISKARALIVEMERTGKLTPERKRELEVKLSEMRGRYQNVGTYAQVDHARREVMRQTFEELGLSEADMHKALSIAARMSA